MKRFNITSKLVHKFIIEQFPEYVHLPISEVEKQGSDNSRGAAQVLIVCVAHDNPKHKFLMDQNLSINSDWFVVGIA